jgi:hypothetical protein
MRLLLPPRRKAMGSQFDVPVQKIVAGPSITTWSHVALGQMGVQLAMAAAPIAAADYERLQKVFGIIAAPHADLIVRGLSYGSDGSGGAYHHGCVDAALYCDAAFNAPKITSALFVAELVEVFSAIQNSGWNCGETNGEALSRCLAEEFYPQVLDSYSESAAWLDSARENFVDQNYPDDRNPQSNGCGVLFLWWLRSLGYPWEKIVLAAGTSLAACYLGLTGKSTAWSDFTAAVNAHWPAGKSSGVMVDNPWGTAPPDNGTSNAVLNVPNGLAPGSYRLSDGSAFVFASAPLANGTYPLISAQ